MINSRKLEDLHPYVQQLAEDFIAKCNEEGINLLVTSTYRDFESQAVLFAQGRTTPGAKVTNAKPGQSFHNYKCALDVVPLSHGKPVWDTTGSNAQIWMRIGELGKEAGLEWAGDWKSFKEFPHFQYTGGLKLSDFQAGKTLDDVLELVEDGAQS